MGISDGAESYILIIGAMKSGTTSLFDALASHPEVAPSSTKEPSFFAFEERWALGFDWYHDQFDFDPARHRYRLDGSTDYSKYPFATGVPERLAASAPRRFKLIYIMRHPLRRIEAHARHVQYQKFHCELGRGRSPIRDHSLDAGISPVNLAASRYATQLAQFPEYSARGDLLALTLEELSEEPERTLKTVLNFLGLSEITLDTSPKKVAANRQRVPQEWQGILNSDASRIGKALLPRSAREAIKRRLRKPVKLEGRFRLTADEEARLAEDLADEMRRLRDDHGIDTERWWGL